MRRLIFIGLLVVVPVFVVVLIISGAIRQPQPNVKRVNLTYWTVENDESAFDDAINGYRRSHPYVRITVVKQRPENYERALIEAWARGTGPDIFSIPNSSVGTFADFITPLPEKTSVYTYATKTVLFRKQLAITKTATPSLTLTRLGTDYVDVVPGDVVRAGKIYGLPLAVDTLAVYFNREILNTAGVVNPPTTWRGLVEQASRLSLLDSQSNVIQSAIALGRADNVNHATDILSLLMLQNGTTMTDASGRTVQFQRGSSDYSPGNRALEFFTDFADPSKEVYGWSAEFTNALDNFVEGKVAYYLGTLRDRAEIVERARASLQFDVAPMFHINEDGTDTSGATNARAKMNAASYWIETVAKQSAHPDEAWSFLQHLARADSVKSYLTKTGGVAALRTLLAEQVKTPSLAVFASQALTARSWYRGEDWPAVEAAFREMITSVAEKTATSSEAIDRAAKAIQLTYTKSP